MATTKQEPWRTETDHQRRSRDTSRDRLWPSRFEWLETVRWPDVALALATLAGVGASTTLCVLFWLMPDLAGFVGENRLPPDMRTRVVVSVLAAGLVPALLSFLGISISRGRLVPRLLTTARLVSPLLLACSIPVLFLATPWHDNPLPYLIGLAIVGLLGERLLRHSFATIPVEFGHRWRAWAVRTSPRLRAWSPLFVVVLASLGYSIYTGYFTILTHRRLGTSSFDLGIYDNLMFTALGGEPFLSRVLYGPDGGNYVGNHAEYAHVLFVPLYAIRPNAETLLIIQSALLGFAAVPLYLFGATLIPRWSAVAVSVGYLLYAPLHGPHFYDFHWLPLAIFFHFWLFWAISTRRLIVGTLMLLVLFAIREDVPIGTALLGIFLMMTGARPKAGVALATSSIAWFALNKFVIMPWAGQWWFANIYKDLIAEGESGYGSIIKTLIANPFYVLKTLATEEKLTYFLHMLAPLVFLPLRRPKFVLLMVPGAFFTLLTTGYAPTLSIAFQYTTHWIPYLFGTTVLALYALRQVPRPNVARFAAIGSVALTLTSHSYVFGAVMQRDTFVGGFSKIRFSRSAAEQSRYEELQSVKSKIPSSASVAATDSEVSHVSARMIVYTLRAHHGDADFLLIYRHGLGFAQTRSTIQDAVSRNAYGLVHDGENYVLLQRGTTTPETSQALRKLGIQKTTPHDPT